MKLSNIMLFKNIKDEDILKILDYVQAKKQIFQKGEFIINAGGSLKKFGIVLKGTAHIINEDFWGERSIITDVKEGDIFGEVYAVMYPRVCEVSAVASDETEVILIDAQKIMNFKFSCDLHSVFMKNIVEMLAEKNLVLTQKIRHMSKKRIRDKLISYFSSESIKNNSVDFYIPFNRQQLADFLSVDRSAMSKELCRMRDEGLIKFRKNHFHLEKNM
ncbi:MAG: Crp/Fnr family transcriptional regulator [Clostridia bacterium]|jgi:CRP-like cAMP-binding protein|nr:Crp/Fnr family transcriptional regulator [Clostridia bacterium]MCI2001117.1 Crp/Fnr family transcriptional regulator [Clostridia bacterium]MCI2015757.1 Crp/Fnr family transcriptional regulator [Clostridia bacterium]